MWQEVPRSRVAGGEPPAAVGGFLQLFLHPGPADAVGGPGNYEPRRMKRGMIGPGVIVCTWPPVPSPFVFGDAVHGAGTRSAMWESVPFQGAAMPTSWDYIEVGINHVVIGILQVDRGIFVIDLFLDYVFVAGGSDFERWHKSDF